MACSRVSARGRRKLRTNRVALVFSARKASRAAGTGAPAVRYDEAVSAAPRPPATLDDFLRVAAESKAIELIAGQIVHKAPPTGEHGGAQIQLGGTLHGFNRRDGGPRRPGRLVADDGGRDPLREERRGVLARAPLATTSCRSSARSTSTAFPTIGSWTLSTRPSPSCATRRRTYASSTRVSATPCAPSRST